MKMNAKTKAVAQADAYLNNVGMPNYTDLLNLAKRTVFLLAENHDITPNALALRNAAVDAIKLADPKYYGLTD
jgi:hypothetical protein